MLYTICEKRIPQTLSSNWENIVFKINHTTNSQWNPSQFKHPDSFKQNRLNTVTAEVTVINSTAIQFRAQSFPKTWVLTSFRQLPITFH